MTCAQKKKKKNKNKKGVNIEGINKEVATQPLIQNRSKTWCVLSLTTSISPIYFDRLPKPVKHISREETEVQSMENTKFSFMLTNASH